MTTHYGYLQQTTGLATLKVNFSLNTGVGHAQCSFDVLSVGLPLASAIAGEVKTIWANRVMPFMDIGLVLTQVECILWDGTEIQEAITASVTIAGGITGVSMVSPNSAVLVKKVTGLIGKENRGRFYVPGLPITDLSDPSTISNTALTNLQAAFDNVYNDLVANDLTMNVIRHTNNAALNHRATVQLLTVEQTLATQRRRLRKVAHH